MSTIVIEELGGQKRALTLRGSGLPLQGAEWGGEMVVDTSWNPGSPVATQQVLGPTEAPSDWSGEWRTNRLVSLPCLLSAPGVTDQTLARADTLREVADSFRVGGQLLRVTWVAAPGRRRVRVGRLTKLTTNDDRADDLAWHMTFDWVSRGDLSAAAIPDADQTLAAQAAAAQAATDAASRIEADAIITANKAVPGGPTPFSLGQLEALADGPRQLASQFARFATAVSSRIAQVGDILSKTRDAPAAVVNQLVDAATNAVAVSNQFVDQLTRQGPETQSTTNRVAALLTAASYYGSAQTGAEILAEAAARTRLAAQRRRTAALRPGADQGSLAGSGDLLAVIVPTAADTVLSLSRRYYAGADLSYELCRANGIPGDTVVPPRGPFILPRRQVLDRFRMGA